MRRAGFGHDKTVSQKVLSKYLFSASTQNLLSTLDLASLHPVSFRLSNPNQAKLLVCFRRTIQKPAQQNVGLVCIGVLP